MTVLLDTGVVIAGYRVPGGEPSTITALTLAELEHGVVAAVRAGLAREVRTRANRLAATRSVYGEGMPFDGAAARSYGVLVDAVLGVGRNPRPRAIDLLIAAVAHANGCAVITTQPDEFRSLGDLLDIRAVGSA